MLHGESGLNKIKNQFEPFATRTHEEMKDVLMDPNADGPENHYYMIRGGKDKTNVTVWESGTVGGEFIKTHGHYHIDTEETYWIVGGEGIVLLQQRKIDQKGNAIDNEIEIFIAINVKGGDIINMPSGIGHLVVNTGKTWLVTIDDSPIKTSDTAKFPSHHDYGSVKKMHGFGYYITDKAGKPELIKNKNYKSVPNIQWLTPEQWHVKQKRE